MADQMERKVFIELECGGYIARKGFQVLLRGAGGLPEFVIEGQALDALLAACLEASGSVIGETFTVRRDAR